MCVFAPAPILTVTVEAAEDEREELHVHAGGQGFWVARMLGVLGARAVLCVPLGGETGTVFGHLADVDGVELRVIRAAHASGAYVHDRRTGERHEWWRSELGPLGRHEVDDLYTATLAAALESGVCVLTGTHRQASVLPVETYTRLAADRGLARLSGVLCEGTAPPMTVVISSCAGDSMTTALAFAWLRAGAGGTRGWFLVGESAP